MRSLRLRPIALAAILLAAPASNLSWAVVRYVKADATGANNGTSWANAYTGLQSALAVAVSGDEIWVTAGTYTPATNGDRGATFMLRTGVAIYGGFIGTEALRTQRDWAANVTILSGDLHGNDGPSFSNNSENSYHVVTGSGCDATALLDGFVLTSGNANGSGSNQNGGGLYNNAGSPTIRNTTFIRHSGYYGGAIANYAQSSPLISNCRFSNNSIYVHGGAIYSESSAPYVVNCEFVDNHANNGSAIGDLDASSRIEHCVFNTNTGVNGYGGALFLQGSSSTLSRCRFVGNVDGYGGAIRLQLGTLTVIASEFLGNTAEWGGAIDNFQGSLQLIDCLFSGNTGTSYGGAVYTPGGSTTVINCTFSGNYADQGGGMWIQGDTILKNSVLWNNSDGMGVGLSSQLKRVGGSLDAQRNCTQGGSLVGAGNISADPRFLDPVGPDGVPGTEDDDLRLAGGSPCIDSGLNAFLPADVTDVDNNGNTTELLPLDVLGFPRIVNGTVDMGACEGPHLALVLSTSSVAVHEGSSVTVGIALAMAPPAPLHITIIREYGDTDLVVTGASDLLFQSSNYGTFQYVTIAAAEDPDFANGAATFKVTGEGVPSVFIQATEIDNDSPQPIVYVNEAVRGANSGLTWTDAFTNLQDALTAARSSGGVVQQIWVAGGHYKPGPAGADRTSTFQLVSGVGLYGGFSGTETLAGQRVAGSHPTCLSGDLAGNDTSPFNGRGENVYHVVTVVNLSGPTVLDGFSIQGGSAINPTVNEQYRGGGLYVVNSTLTLRNCIVSDNQALWGGAANCELSNVVFDQCELSANRAINDDSNTNWVYGGALRIAEGAVSLIGCVVKDNLASTPGNANYSYGGAVFNAGNLTMTDCTVLRNSAGRQGGGLSNGNGGTATIIHSTFQSNNILGVGPLPLGGGAVFADPGSLTCVGVSFFGNDSGETTGGAVYLGYGGSGPNPSPNMTNCIFAGNHGSRGAAVYIDDQFAVSFRGCTFFANCATMSGGAIDSFGSSQPGASLFNCISWGNAAPVGSSLALRTRGFPVIPSAALIESSDLQGGLAAIYVEPGSTLDWVDSNHEDNPTLTSTGHLRSGSPSLGAASISYLPADLLDLDHDGNRNETVPYDVDGAPEQRLLGNRLDLGADELNDSDNDHLPDWWELKYFGSTTAAQPTDDPDHDGLTNREEYELFSSNPMADPWYVDGVNGDDSWNGKATVHSNDPLKATVGPKRTIQAGLGVAQDYDTVLVAPGTYSGTGNYELDFARKWVIVGNSGTAGSAIIDCGQAGRAVKLDSVQGAFAALDGFTIRNGNGQSTAPDPAGGGVRADQSRLFLRNCELVSNTSTTTGGGVYSKLGTPTFGDVTLGNPQDVMPRDPNIAPEGDAGTFDSSNVNLEGPLTVLQGTLESRSSWFDGPPGDGVDTRPARIELGSGTTLKITGDAGAAPTVVRSDVTGSGTLQIDPGQQLTLGGQAKLDLTAGGHVNVQGILVAQDQATIQGASIDVKQAQITTSEPVQYNDVHLIDGMAAGGEFFVQGHSSVLDNAITSEGDRYLDLDPDPQAGHPTIRRNHLTVQIKTAPNVQRGTLLELRAKDYDCGTTTNSDCRSGALHVSSNAGFTADPSDNWVLDRLEVQAGGKLNLTNRPGLVYQPPRYLPDGRVIPEAVYVKDLVLYPNAVLNTALQTLYYQNLKDENGNPLVRDPNDLSAPMANGSQIIDVPLLGFSLGIIALNDTQASPFNEFDLRIRQRLRDSADVQDCRCDGICANNSPPKDSTTCKEGAVTHLLNARSTNDGVMEMRTQASGKQPASSVAAKGSFARAGDENITITFDYLFFDNPNAQLAVYLSDNEDVGVRSFEVARVSMPASGLPASGRPGSIGSGQFATFYARVPRVTASYTLNFTRGTYVELALIASRDGQNNPVPSRIWIDNFDPQIICSSQCADLSGEGGVTSRDYLLLMSEYGQTIRQAGLSKACLDMKVSADNYVDLFDLLAFDSVVGPTPPPNACGALQPPSAQQSRLAKITPAAMSNRMAQNAASPDVSRLVITGKSSLVGQQSDALYTLNKSTMGCVGGGALPPAGGAGTRSNGRLITDSAGNVYQLHGTQGLVLIGGSPVVPPHYFSSVTMENGSVQAHVGVNAPGGYYSGLPLADAAFSPTDPSIVYVVPVLVTPTAGCPYKAAGKLQLTGNGGYNVVTLYGRNPASYSSVEPDSELGCDPVFYVPEPDRQEVREIEVDTLGHVFVLAAQAASPDNDWLLIYNEADGNDSEHAEMISGSVRGPTAMLVSSSNRLYLASSVDALPASQTRIYRFDIMCYTGTGTCLNPLTPIDISNPTDPQQDQGFGYFARITAIQEDTADGKIYVTGFTAPRFSPTKTFTGNESLFTLPTLATFNPAENGPVSPAQPISCHNLALPLSMVFGSVTGIVVADFNGDGHVDGIDFDLFKKCSTRSGVPYNPSALPSGCTLIPDAQGKIPADFDKDSDVDMNDFAKFQRCYSGSNHTPDAGCAG